MMPRVCYVRDYSKRMDNPMIRFADPKPTPDHLFAYTGRELDPEGGLQVNHLRYFDPTVGRWLNEEPAGYADAALHRHVGNQPH